MYTMNAGSTNRGFGKPKVEIQNTNADFRDALEQVKSRLSKSLR